MSSTTTTAGIPSGYWSVKRYAIAVALVLALAIAAFSAGYLLTDGEPASTAAVEGTGAGNDASSRTTDDRGVPGPLRGRIQP